MTLHFLLLAFHITSPHNGTCMKMWKAFSWIELSGTRERHERYHFELQTIECEPRHRQQNTFGYTIIIRHTWLFGLTFFHNSCEANNTKLWLLLFCVPSLLNSIKIFVFYCNFSLVSSISADHRREMPYFQRSGIQNVKSPQCGALMLDIEVNTGGLSF